MERLISEELLKNNVLMPSSQKINFLRFDNFDGVEAFKINGVTNLEFGVVYIKYSNAQNLEILYGNSKILFASGTSFNVIPLKIKKNQVLKMSGKADSIILELQNIESDLYSTLKLLPLNNKMVCRCGNTKIYSYTDYSDILNSSMNVFEVDSGVLDCQLVSIGGVLVIIKIKSDNGVYCCSSMDNYTNKINIAEDSDSVSIVSNVKDDNIDIVYLRKSQIFYKTIDSNWNIGEEISVFCDNQYKPKKLLDVQIDAFGIPVFLVKFENGTLGVFVKEFGKYILKIVKICDNARLVIDGDIITLIIVYDYTVQIYKYKIVVADNLVISLRCVGNSQVDNVLDAIKINDGYIAFSANSMSYISEYDIF